MKAQTLVRDDPERLLSFGEAANLLGVADMQLGGAIRAGQLVARVGSCDGRVSRLIRAGDLAALDPLVLDRELPAPRPNRHSGAGLDWALGPAGGEGLQGLDEGQGSLSPGAASGEALTAEAGASDTGDLERRLVESQRREQGLLAMLEEEQERHRVQLFEHQASHDRTSQSLLAHRRIQGMLVLGFLISSAVLVRSWHQLPMGLSGVAVAATGADGAVGGLPVEALPSSAQEDVEPVDALEAPGLDLGHGDGGPDQIGALLLRDDGAPTHSVAPMPAIPGANEGDVSAPFDPLPWVSVEPEFLWLAPARDDGPPCHFHALTRPGTDLRGLIGPCAGPWNSSCQAVAGLLRLEGVSYCRHHHFFVSRLGGSVDRAREIAQLARSEGLVPPLMALRVERAGSAFLRRRVGEWLDSGFQSGQVGGHEHQLESCPDPDRWRIRSWVLYRDVGGNEIRTSFSMLLQVGDDFSGDRLLELVWPGSGR